MASIVKEVALNLLYGLAFVAGLLAFMGAIGTAWYFLGKVVSLDFLAFWSGIFILGGGTLAGVYLAGAGLRGKF